jgi:hypothetical protein
MTATFSVSREISLQTHIGPGFLLEAVDGVDDVDGQKRNATRPLGMYSVAVHKVLDRLHRCDAVRSQPITSSGSLGPPYVFPHYPFPLWLNAGRCTRHICCFWKALAG